MSFEMFFRDLESVKTPETSRLLCKCCYQGKGEVRIVPNGGLDFSEPCSKDNPCFIICSDSKRFSSHSQVENGSTSYHRTVEDKRAETRQFLERLFGVPPNSRDYV